MGNESCSWRNYRVTYTFIAHPTIDVSTIYYGASVVYNLSVILDVLIRNALRSKDLFTTLPPLLP